MTTNNTIIDLIFSVLAFVRSCLKYMFQLYCVCVCVCMCEGMGGGHDKKRHTFVMCFILLVWNHQLPVWLSDPFSKWFVVTSRISVKSTETKLQPYPSRPSIHFLRCIVLIPIVMDCNVVYNMKEYERVIGTDLQSIPTFATAYMPSIDLLSNFKFKDKYHR